MTPRRFIPAVVLLSALATVPAFAQDRGDRGGDRRGGGDRGSRGDGGGRAVQRSPRAERSYDRPRQYQSRQRDVQAYDARRDDSRRYEARRSDSRRYDSRRYDSRGYDARRYDSRRSDSRGYDARRYDGPRAVPRPYVYRDYRGYRDTRGYRDNRGYRSYPRVYRNYPPRYYSRGYYGYYGSYRGHYGYYRPRIITAIPWRPYHYRPRFSIGVFYGVGGHYEYGYTPSSYYDPSPGRIYGGVRIVDAPREAQVFADGYYVGIVDDFDGVFQHVNLEAGPHRIEIREPGVDQGIAFDVDVQPGRTITLRAEAY
jgi:hypothetical protein